MTIMSVLAFQPDSFAQTRRGGNERTATQQRSSSSQRSTSSRSSSSNSRSSSTSQRSTTPQRSSNSQQRTTSTRSTSRTSSSDNKKATKPSASTRPTGTTSRPKIDGAQKRPSTTVTRPTTTRPTTTSPNRQTTTPTRTTPTRRPTTTQPTVRGEGRREQVTTGPSRTERDRPKVEGPTNQRPTGQNHGDKRPFEPRIHPRDRDFMAYDRPSSYWARHDHFFGCRVKMLPSHARRHHHHGITYYCYNDIWYRPYDGYYIVCRPPFGTVLAANMISDMIWTSVRMAYYKNQRNQYYSSNPVPSLGLTQTYASSNLEYFYQDGVFYVINAYGDYEVIIPPAGALVEELPEDYDIIILSGKEYYRVDNTVYRLIVDNGRPYFEVLGQQY